MSFDLKALEQALSYQSKNADWLLEALSHRSYHKENPECPHNEILEFLGDAVLDLVISDMLIEKFSGDQEGSLSRKRASVVNEDRLCELAQKCRLDEFLLVGAREENNNLRTNPRILASALEAVIGAIYKDSGFERVNLWIRQEFSLVIDQAFSEHDFEKDYKTRFQEWVQDKFKRTPRYVVIEQVGPDHAREFTMEVFIGDDSWGTAKGASKKMAAQNAAKQALERIS